MASYDIVILATFQPFKRQSVSIQLIQSIKLSGNLTSSLPEMDGAKADLPNQT